MVVGFAIWRKSQSHFWNLAQTIAVEDSPYTVLEVSALKKWYDSLSDPTGHGRLAVLRACEVLAEGKKNRKSDELLHLIIAEEKGYLPSKVVYEQILQNARKPLFEDKEFVGLLARGYRYFVETKTHCDNEEEAYCKWRKFWVELMRNAPITKEDLAPE